MAVVLYLGSAFIVSLVVWFIGVPWLERVRQRHLEPWSRRHFR